MHYKGKDLNVYNLHVMEAKLMMAMESIFGHLYTDIKNFLFL